MARSQAVDDAVVDQSGEQRVTGGGQLTQASRMCVDAFSD